MAKKYDAYNPRLESLVIETATFWDPDVADLSEAERNRFSKSLQKDPQQASKIHYERMHTGLARQITVTAADVERLRQEPTT